jgi:hypothetical protein
MVTLSEFKKSRGINEDVSQTIDQALFLEFLRFHNLTSDFMSEFYAYNLFKGKPISFLFKFVSSKDFIANAFEWRDTKQGCDFWADKSPRWFKYYMDEMYLCCPECLTSYTLLSHLECPICNQNK